MRPPDTITPAGSAAMVSLNMLSVARIRDHTEDAVARTPKPSFL